MFLYRSISNSNKIQPHYVCLNPKAIVMKFLLCFYFVNISQYSGKFSL
jgi:hypothetical protein